MKKESYIKRRNNTQKIPKHRIFKIENNIKNKKANTKRILKRTR
jgi:hypothetical protein